MKQVMKECNSKVSKEREVAYFVVGDLEYLSANVLYSGEPCGKDFNFAQIGSCSDFQSEGPNNISIEHDLGQYIPEAQGFSLMERYDATNHNNSLFHLNQDLPGVNSGTSKKNADGYKGLGLSHNMPLFDLD